MLYLAVEEAAREMPSAAFAMLITLSLGGLVMAALIPALSKPVERKRTQDD